MKRTLLLISVLAVVAVIVPVASANHPAGWHWRRGSDPYTVEVRNGATGVWTDAVNTAASKWSNKSTVLDLDVQSGSGCGATAGVVKVCNGSFPGTWAGLTTVVLNGPHIATAVVQLDNSAQFAARAVACHELGHALGLGHRAQSETSSCMTPSVAASQRHPDRHDYGQLKRIYRHLDGSGAQAEPQHTEVIETHRDGDITVLKFYDYITQ